jgi:glutamate/tyrosine decarboxylase-like PLP-dependent enzyme
MLLRFLIVFATDCHFCFSKVAKWTGAGLVDAVVKGTGGRGIFRVQRLERRQQRESTEGGSQNRSLLKSVGHFVRLLHCLE